MQPNTDRQAQRLWRRLSGAIIAGGLAGILLAADKTALAQSQPASPKLYIFDVGSLKSGNPQPLLDRGVTVTDMSVTAYLIVHPRGTLLWDAGTIVDPARHHRRRDLEEIADIL